MFLVLFFYLVPKIINCLTFPFLFLISSAKSHLIYDVIYQGPFFLLMVLELFIMIPI